MREKDLFSSIFLLLVGIAFIVGGLALDIGTLNTPGPGFMPVILGGAQTFLALLLLGVTVFNRLPREKFRFWQSHSGWKKVLSGLLASTFYLVTLNHLGYLLTTSLFLVYLLRFIGKKAWLPSLFVGIIASLASYFIFRSGLEVLLPRGLIKLG